MKVVFKSLATKSLVYGLGNSLSGLVGLILIPFYIRHLEAAEYGRYALAEMVLNLLLVLFGLGLNVAVLARYPRSKEPERSSLIGTVFGFLLVFTVVGNACFLLCVAVARKAVLPNLSFSYFVLVSAITAVETIWLLFATLYRAQGRAWRFIVISLVQDTVGLVATVGLIVRFGFREEGILYGRLIGDAAVVASLLPDFLSYRPRFNFAPAIDVVKLGIPLLPATFASMWIGLAPRYFIEHLGTTTQVGVFAISAKLASVVNMLFVQPFALGWIPIMFEVFQRRDARAVYSRVITYYVVLGGVVALGLGLLAPAVEWLLGRADYRFDPTVLLLLCVANVLGGLMHAVNVGPYVRERTGRQVPVFVFVALLTIPLCLVLVARFGVLGAAFSLLAAYLIQSILLNMVSQRLLPIPLEYGRMGGAAVILIVAYAVSGTFIRQWPPVQAVAARSVVFGSLVGAALYLTGFFRPLEAPRDAL